MESRRPTSRRSSKLLLILTIFIWITLDLCQSNPVEYTTQGTETEDEDSNDESMGYKIDSAEQIDVSNLTPDLIPVVTADPNLEIIRQYETQTNNSISKSVTGEASFDSRIIIKCESGYGLTNGGKCRKMSG